MLKILNTNLKNITRIIHIGDIHCRLNSRIFEFREVFSNFFNDIKHLPKEETIIVNVGDTVHNKNQMEPEGIQLVKELFLGCANLFPTIIIPGNHDGLIQNKNRLDSITPIIEMLNNPNLYYLKESGLYGFGNILFNNMSIFDNKYILGKDIPSIYRNQYKHIIALFHGPIDGSVTATGHRIENPSIMLPLFDGNELVLCGDIHGIQVLQEYDSDNNKPCIKFCGSFLQQNHGESLDGHGYSLWDLSDYSHVHHEVKNDYGYFTIEVNKGKLITDLTNIPKKIRLRIKNYNSITTEINVIIAKIKELTEVIEVSYLRMEQDEEDKNATLSGLANKIVLSDLTNINYQNKLITEFLDKKLSITDSLKVKKILEINAITNSLIKQDTFSRNLVWKPIRLSWENLFKYGEDNVIQFENMSGIYGIFSKNTSGKTSIIDTLLFVLFDKTSRAFKGEHVLNSQKDSFNCTLEFEVDSIRYFIERKGSRNLKSGNVKVDVRFWKMIDGNEEELHGTDRRDTNDIIRDYVGTYEDFVTTAASFQHAKDYTPFIDMGNSERKDLLVQFIGLNVFDRLHESAGERNKELNIILKLHKNKNYSEDIKQNQTALDHANVLFEEKTKEISNIKQRIDNINEQIILETSSLIKLDTDVPTNLKDLENKRTLIELSIRKKQQLLIDSKLLLDAGEIVISNINEQIQKIEASNLVESHNAYTILSNKINEIKQQLNTKKNEIDGKLDKVSRLDKHKYDPNCRFCVDNDFVKDAIKAKTELVNDKETYNNILLESDTLKTDYTKLQWVEQIYETYTKLLTKRGEVKDEYSNMSRNSIINTNDLEKLNLVLKEVGNQIDLYHKNKVSVESNEKIKTKITAYRSNFTSLNTEFHRHNKLLMDISGKRELFQNQIVNLNKIITDVTAMENEAESYKNYLVSVGRDGIPYQVICNVVPQIEKNINAILSQISDFTLQFETDGKNIIPYIIYEYGKKYPLELACGYERFITSIAIRVGITEVSNLPKISSLFLDEVLTTLDSDHIAMMPTLLSILKNYYTFIIIINHDDHIKDAVDKTIEISSVGNFAKVMFE